MDNKHDFTHDFSMRVGANVFHAIWHKGTEEYEVILGYNDAETFEMTRKATTFAPDADAALHIGLEWVMENKVKEVHG